MVLKSTSNSHHWRRVYRLWGINRCLLKQTHFIPVRLLECVQVLRYVIVCGGNTQCSIRVAIPLAQVFRCGQSVVSKNHCPPDCTLRHCCNKTTWQLLQVTPVSPPPRGLTTWARGCPGWHNPPPHPDGKLKVDVHEKVPLEPWHTLLGQPASPGLCKTQKRPQPGGWLLFHWLRAPYSLSHWPYLLGYVDV